MWQPKTKTKKIKENGKTVMVIHRCLVFETNVFAKNGRVFFGFWYNVLTFQLPQDLVIYLEKKLDSFLLKKLVSVYTKFIIHTGCGW
jgi:hypothetical protein